MFPSGIYTDTDRLIVLAIPALVRGDELVTKSGCYGDLLRECRRIERDGTALAAGDFNRDGERIEVALPGTIALNDSNAYIDACLAGLGLGRLPFSFGGLVIASVLYSMPFVVQPIRNAFEAFGDRPLEVAATLRASPWDAFWSVAVPLAIIFVGGCVAAVVPAIRAARVDPLVVLRTFAPVPSPASLQPCAESIQATSGSAAASRPRWAQPSHRRCRRP